jgi:hypothetical protein
MTRISRIRFDFGTLILEADLLDTPTARAIAAALPISSSALTWGEEVYFEVPVKIPAESDARAVVHGNETRLASPCNIFARAVGDVKTLAKVRGGMIVKVSSLG